MNGGVNWPADAVGGFPVDRRFESTLRHWLNIPMEGDTAERLSECGGRDGSRRRSPEDWRALQGR